MLLLLMAGLAAGAGLFELRDYDPPPYPQSRAPFVTQLAKQFGPSETLVLGDSLVEQTNFSAVCGRTFNAGIGGARVQDVRRALPALIGATQPERVIVAVGANHFVADDELADFRRQYPLLLDELASRDLVLVGVSNSREASDFVQQQAQERGLTYIAPITAPLQEDGLHHTVAGSRMFREAVAATCPAKQALSQSASRDQA